MGRIIITPLTAILSFMAILCAAFGNSTSASAEASAAIRKAETQLSQLHQRELQQRKLWQLNEQVWQLQQDLKQNQRIQQKQHNIFVKAELGQENSGVVKEERGQATVCMPIEYVDPNGVTRLSFTDESCDEQVMHPNGSVVPNYNPIPMHILLQADILYPNKSQQDERRQYIIDEMRTEKDREQGHSYSFHGESPR